MRIIKHKIVLTRKINKVSEHMYLLTFSFYFGSLCLCLLVLFVCLFDLILYVPSAIFQLNRDGSSWAEPVLSQDKCVLLKEHNAVKPVRPFRLESSTLPLSHCAPSLSLSAINLEIGISEPHQHIYHVTHSYGQLTISQWAYRFLFMQINPQCCIHS